MSSNIKNVLCALILFSTLSLTHAMGTSPRHSMEEETSERSKTMFSSGLAFGAAMVLLSKTAQVSFSRKLRWGVALTGGWLVAHRLFLSSDNSSKKERNERADDEWKS